jgi:UTP--glucose-1-phosphate uridylyltransferase
MLMGLTVQLRSSLANYVFDSKKFAQLKARVSSGELDPSANRLSAPPRPLQRAPIDLRPELARRRLGSIGESAIRAGRFAILVLNGGMATRFGGGAKGVVPVVEGVEAASFLAVKLGQVRRLGERLRASIPAVLMHSFATQTSSIAHLEIIDWAGLPPTDRDAFAQSIMPRVLPDGTPLAELPEASDPSAGLADTDLYAAPGHGDTLARLRKSGVLSRLLARGVEHVLVSNVDNLGASLDPVVAGAHLEAVARGDGITVEVVRRESGDAGGCVAELPDGTPAIIEGFRLPQGTDLGDYPHFNTNTLWLSLDAVDRDIDLSWFAVRKSIAWPDAGRAPDGQLEVVQFETLIGQVTESVGTTFVDVDRSARFVPIKTREDLHTHAESLARFARDAGVLA